VNPPLRERLRWAGQEPTPADATADRAVMARSFVYLYGAGSALSFATLLLPHASDRWAPGVALVGAAAGLVTLVTLIGFDRLPVWLFYCLPPLGTVHIAFITHWGGTGSLPAYAMFFTWVVLSSFYFLSRRLAIVNLFLVVGVYGLVIALSGGLETPALHWVMLSGTMVVGGLLIGLLRDTVATTLRRLEATTEVALAISGDTGLTEVLDLIAARGRALLEARTVAIVLADGDGPHVAATAGAWSEREEARVLTSLAEPDRSSLVVPLVFRGRGKGVLVALDRLTRDRKFTAADERLAVSFAASAATAVGNAQSVEEDRLRQRIVAGEYHRRRWARDLHDSTLQGLGGLRVLLSSAIHRRDPRQLEGVVRDSLGHLGTEIENLHSIISDLRPPALDTLGLGPALEGLADRTARMHGVEVRCVLALPPRGSRGEALEGETTVFRVAQEALANVAKHSGARRARLEVAADSGELTLRIEDDGAGFDAAAPPAGFGLRAMRERVTLAGGNLEIDSGPGRGTLVRAVLPWHDAGEEGGGPSERAAGDAALEGAQPTPLGAPDPQLRPA
jgi:signal transduction histidine kinase